MNPKHNICGTIVLQNGTSVFEQYYNGCDSQSLFHVTSVTKSILSALIGIAVDKKYIHSIDQPVLDFFPGYASHSAAKKAVTIRHLLTMTAPFAYPDWQEPFAELCSSPDWTVFALDRMGEGGQIGAFKYSSCGVHLLSCILSKATGMNARDFANQYLFAPCGMQTVPVFEMEGYGIDELFGQKVRGWVSDPAGNSTGGWGLTLTLRDMARFGSLYLQKGCWNNVQIIPETWITDSVRMNPYHYGYLWWLKEENSSFSYAAMGDGGNTICCMPEKDMVIAVAAV